MYQSVSHNFNHVPVTRHGRIYMGACVVTPITYRSFCVCVIGRIYMGITPLRTKVFLDESRHGRIYMGV